MRAYLGLGSNIGDRLQNLHTAVHILEEKGIVVNGKSPVYETLPVGNENQDLFLNAALAIETDLSPNDLLDLCYDVEKAIGRVRDVKWGPRVIDLDILLYNNLSIMNEKLTVPHPLMHTRAFVLKPLADIAPSLIHPLLGISISDLLGRADKSGIYSVAGIL